MPEPAINCTVSVAVSATMFVPFALICLNVLVTTLPSSATVTLLFTVSGVIVILSPPLISTVPFSSTKLVLPFVTVTLDNSPLVLAVSTLAIKALTSAFVNESATSL